MSFFPRENLSDLLQEFDPMLNILTETSRRVRTQKAKEQRKIKQMSNVNVRDECECDALDSTKPVS